MHRYVLKVPTPSGTSVDYDRELNAQQLKVVLHPGGPMLVIAGAGSGKTRTVTYRVAHLLEQGIPPDRVLLVTFTNKAAREMLRRVEQHVQASTRDLWGGTFHHIGHRVLRRHGERVGLPPGFTILDPEDARDLLETVTAELGIDTRERRFPKGDVLHDVLSLAADTGEGLEAIVTRRYPFFLEWTGEIARVGLRYHERKRRQGLVDFDDLLLLWRQLLRDHPEVGDEFSDRFLHVLVDEYQDTNRLQAEIVDLVARGHRNVMVVGDDAQSIYSFRGADFANIMEFPRRYPDATVFKLETNYRSRPPILELANESIAHNRRQFQKHLTAVRTDGGGNRPVGLSCRDPQAQAAFVGQRILELRDEGVPLPEIAVLYRSHYHSMEIQMELTRRGIPFEVRSGLRFFEQAHIKDVTSYLRAVVNPKDEVAWKRMMRLYPRIGPRTADKVWEAVAAQPSPAEGVVAEAVRRLLPGGARGGWEGLSGIVRRISEPASLQAPSEAIRTVLEGGYLDLLRARYTEPEARIEDIEQLQAFAGGYDSLESFLAELSLMASIEGETVRAGGETDERVVLTSVHQAKGLEWGVVFLVWLADGRFPAARSLREPEGEEEERRLFYVAVTRAKDELYLVYPIFAPERHMMQVIQKPSRFLEELPRGVTETWSVEEERA